MYKICFISSLCDGGCVLSISGIGLGLVSMSPPNRRKSSWIVFFVGVLYFCE